MNPNKSHAATFEGERGNETTLPLIRGRNSGPHAAGNPVRVAVVGCGNFARRQHLPNLAAMPGVILETVCDTDWETASTAAANYGARKATRETAEVIADESVDAVVIAVPDARQAAIAQAALEGGKHVYLEKPGGVSHREFRAVMEVHARSHREVAVGFNKRFSPAYTAAARLIRTGGGPRNLLLRMSDDAWRWAANLPRGALLGHDACHLFDLAAWLTESRAQTVYAAAARDDDYSITLTFANGAVATIILSGHASMDFPKERLEAITDRGGIIVDDYVELNTFGHGPWTETCVTFPGRASRPADAPWVDRMGTRGLAGMLDVRRALHVLHNGASEAKRTDATVLPNFLRDQGWFQSLNRFIEAIRAHRPPPHATLHDAFRTFLIATAARRSLATGRVETVAKDA